MKHIYTLIFYFIQARLGGTQQGSAEDILQFPGPVLQKHIKLSETSIRRQRIDFFEVKTEGIAFSPSCVFSSPTYYLLFCFFSPSPVRLHNPRI